ncbi:MAG: DUF6391 domain-containing protein [bacterium]
MRNLDWLQPLTSLFSSTTIPRIRRNHGLEHATVTVVSEKLRNLRLSGRATASGFYIYGKIDTEDLTAAVHEALHRLKSGEARLAVHPNCGTNLVTKGLAAGLAAYWVLSSANSTQSKRQRLPQVTLASTLAVLAGQPLGGFLQKHVTTSADMGSLRVVDIQRNEQGRFVKHFVSTEE